MAKPCVSPGNSGLYVVEDFSSAGSTGFGNRRAGRAILSPFRRHPLGSFRHEPNNHRHFLASAPGAGLGVPVQSRSIGSLVFCQGHLRKRSTPRAKVISRRQMARDPDEKSTAIELGRRVR